MLLSFGYLVLSRPTPLRLQEFVAIHSIMLAMGFVSQMKLASAIRVCLKILGESYSTEKNPRPTKIRTENARLQKSETEKPETNYNLVLTIGNRRG